MSPWRRPASIRPVWYVLEGQAELVLANAHHIKNVPGRKTDVNDAMWIADLLAHGLIRSSFVPPQPIQELRDLTRTRKQLVREISQHSLRIQKVLEDANIKLGSVLSEVLGVSGRAMIEGESDARRLADLAHDSPRRKHDELVEALHGHVRPHHRTLLTMHLNLIVTLEHTVGELDAVVGKCLEPIHQRAPTMPGVGEASAEVTVAEIGIDMARFPTLGHLISWYGLCPLSDESAGKPIHPLRKGANWLKTTLVTAAWAAVRTKASYLRALFLRLKARRGAKKAIMAVAASMLTADYFMLRDGVPYRDFGPSHFDHQHTDKIVQRLLRRQHDLGYCLPHQLKPA